VKRLYAWLAGVVGGAAVYRAFRRRPPAPPVAGPADPAEALKAKLAETRAVTDEATAAAAAAPDADVDARRQSVHERARATIDEMHESDPD
jgi:hypothetical protein